MEIGSFQRHNAMNQKGRCSLCEQVCQAGAIDWDQQEEIVTLDVRAIVVASCTPRIHEPLFKDACEEAGLNRYLFEFVNVREHCSWIGSRRRRGPSSKS